MILAISALVLVAGVIMLLSYLWGESKGRGAENATIRKAFENAGLSKDAMDKVLAGPLDAGHGLFDNWVRQDRDN